MNTAQKIILGVWGFLTLCLSFPAGNAVSLNSNFKFYHVLPILITWVGLTFFAAALMLICHRRAK